MSYPLGRIPVIALDYSEADKAVPKEVLIDYETGDIYVVNSDGTKIFDITSQIRTLIESGELGANMIVNVEGVGDVQLTTYLSWLNQTSITATPVGCVHNSIPRAQTDLRSLTIKNNILQVYGFDKALNGDLPIRENGIIVWKDAATILAQLADPDYVPSTNNAGAVVVIEPDASGKIKMTTDSYQRTAALENAATLVLPTETKQQYTKLTWNYISSETNPEITFEGNIIWQSESDKIIMADSVHVLEFETWDYGVTWFVDTKVFGRPADESVTMEYLEENVYDKDEINDFLSWKTKTMPKV